MILLNVILLNVFSLCLLQKISASILLPNINSEFLQIFLRKRHNNVTKQCKSSLKLYMENLNNFGQWGTDMYQANSKISKGILYGNVLNLGNFDSCLQIEASTRRGTVYGKYCLGSEQCSKYHLQNYVLKRHSMKEQFHEDVDDNQREIMLNWGLCFPSNCSSSEGEELFRYFYPNVTINEEFCLSRDKNLNNWNNTEIILLSFLLLWCLLIIIATFCDIISSYFKYNLKIWKLFSLYENWKKLFYEPSEVERLKCVDGIGVFTTFSVILGNEFSLFSLIPQLHTHYYKEWKRSILSVEAVGASLNSETFLVLGGLLTTFNFLRKMDNKKTFVVPKLIIRRFFRYTIPLAPLIVVHNLLFDHYLEGPIMPFLKIGSVKSCQQYWWSTLLHIQNYNNGDNICLPHTWYLDVYLQLYIFSCIVLVGFYYGYKRATLHTFALMIIISTSFSFYLMWGHELNANSLSIPTSQNEGLSFFTEFYIKTHARMAPWFLGMFLGYILYKDSFQNSKIILNKVTVSLMWLLSLTIMILCIFSVHDAGINNGPYDKAKHALIIALICPAWSLALSWVIFACYYGHAGIIGTIFSQPIFGIIRKMGFSIYLIHFPFIAMVVFRQREQIYFDSFNVNYIFFGDFFYIMVLSLIWSLIFEFPVKNILDIICSNQENNHKQDLKEKLETIK